MEGDFSQHRIRIFFRIPLFHSIEAAFTPAGDSLWAEFRQNSLLERYPGSRDAQHEAGWGGYMVYI